MDIHYVYLLQIIFTILFPWLLVGALGAVMLRGVPFRFSLSLLVMLAAIGVQELLNPVVVSIFNPARTGPATFPSPMFGVLAVEGVCAIAAGYLVLRGLRLLLKRGAGKAA